jgi:GNAT superfamily N-acetyltransferase
MKEVELSLVLEPDIDAVLEAELREALMECYPDAADYFSKRSWWYSRPAWRVIAREDGGLIVGHMAVVLRRVLVAENALPVSVAGIQGVLVRHGHRGTGLSDKIMVRVIGEAARGTTDAGMLFCIPKLESLYGRMGWRKIDAAVSLIGDSGERENLAEKDIAMVYPLKLKHFPAGDIDLNGMVW